MNIKKIIQNIVAENYNNVIIYSAVVIEELSEISKIQKLIEKYVPANQGWRKPHNFHMTISLGKLPEGLYLRGDLNKEVTLEINSIGISDDAIALGASGYYSKNDMPHITIAFHNNSEAAASKNITDWKHIDNFSVVGTIRQVAEGNKIIK